MKIQVKYAWFDESSDNYVVDNRRTKTNRRLMLREAYTQSDFDFALVYVEKLDIFYVFPVEVFISYGSEIHLVESQKRQRKPRSAQYRNAWDLILQRVFGKETEVQQPLNFDEVLGGVMPTQAQSNENQGL